MKLSIFSQILILIFVFSLKASASLIYTPTHFNPETANLLVVIHGCLQSGESMALGSGWDQIANQNNLVVLYAQVPEGTNPMGCWSWFLPENQRADQGQLKMLMDEIRSVKANQNLHHAKVFLAGISAGGTTAAGLMACFPSEFASALIHSAPSYGLAQTVAEGDRIMKEGPPNGATKAPCLPKNYQGTVIVIQGLMDTVVNAKHADRVLSDFTGSDTPTSTKDYVDASGTYWISEYMVNGLTKGRLVRVQGMGHAWSGFAANLRYEELVGPQGRFPTKIPFFNPTGPSATNLAWEFFQSTLKSKRK